MIAALAASVALAGPVLQAPEGSPRERCVQAAAREIDVPLPPSPELAPGAGLTRVALVVGVPCHDDPGIPSLAYSSRDAARVGSLLAEAGYHVVLLTGAVERAGFRAALSRAEAALAPDGELLVYFSGHGVLADHRDRVRRYLVFSDTRMSEIPRSGYSVLELDMRLDSVRAAHKVVIQDTCFAATAGGKSLGNPGAGSVTAKGLPVPEPDLELGAGDARLYASQFYEQAVESPEHRASLYTHHLLDALHTQAADLDGNGCVDLREGHRWARERTTDERRGTQTPLGRFRGSGATNLLGCVPSAPTRGVLQLPDGDRWTVEVRDRAGAVVQRGPGALPAGTYRVRVGELRETEAGEWSHRQLLSSRVQLQPGAWLDLEHEIRRRRAPVHEITADAALRPVSELPALGGGITALRAWPETPVGRPTVAVRSHLAGGAGDGGAAARSVEVLGLVGQTWTARLGRARARLGFGPLVGAGVGFVSRQCQPSGECVGWITNRTSLAQGVLRGRLYVGDALTIALEGGVSAHLQTVDGRLQPRWVPLLRLGVGPRL